MVLLVAVNELRPPWGSSPRSAGFWLLKSNLIFFHTTMYGGLFGDLPAAKSSKEDARPRSSATAEERTSALTSTQGPKETPGYPSEAPKNAPKAADILKTVGSKGTSVAFVPTAARRGNKRGQQTVVLKNDLASITGHCSEAKVVVTNQLPPSKEPLSQSTQPLSPSQTENLGDSSINLQPLEKSEVQGGNETSTARAETSGSEQAQNTLFEPALAEPLNYENFSEEERARQVLHHSVTDPYDPLVPNDLQQYIEMRALEQQRESLEQQRREALELQELLREQLDQQRQQAQRDDSMGGRGRGRGGVSNLPAWMATRGNEGPN